MKHTSRPTTPSASPGSPPFSPPVSLPPLPTSPLPTYAAQLTSSTTTLSRPSTGVTLSPYPTLSTQAGTATPNSQGYRPKVSFDTFENSAASMFSFTLSVKSDGYARNKNARVFLCASSPDESGKHALDWAIESLCQDGDELIVFRGIDPDDLEKDHDVVREEARELMRRIQEKCAEADSERKLSIIVEFIAGKVTQTIDRLIALYRPDSVVVGTRGIRGMMQAMGAAFGATAVGGVSKYCLSNSPVPIIVVRPEGKVRKTLDKRRANPKRGTHFDDGLKLQRQRSHPAGVPMISSMTR
ncbi:hypothetical protein OF83DRAFT_1162822 [Amylostereum chailletii]|nr:hypothetical protein OF83DRAFT_1162822 [Amylostereum chailletii]